MRDIWNPWHGCTKKSEGCQNCYMFVLDRRNGRDGSLVYRNNSNFYYPLQRNRNGGYRIRSGEQLRVCLTSDFFHPQADQWRKEAWKVIHQRPDVIFFILTKRPERVMEHLPKDWNEGWENVFFNVSCENQLRADERIPLLHSLPFKHKGIMCAPLIGPISITEYLEQGQIEQVLCGGENYENPRPCSSQWVRNLSEECRHYDVTFDFIETGSVFIHNGRRFDIPNKAEQSRQAYRSGLSFQGKKIHFDLRDYLGLPIPEDELYHPQFTSPSCNQCGYRMCCNGSSPTGKCGG